MPAFGEHHEAVIRGEILAEDRELTMDLAPAGWHTNEWSCARTETRTVAEVREVWRDDSSFHSGRYRMFKRPRLHAADSLQAAAFLSQLAIESGEKLIFVGGDDSGLYEQAEVALRESIVEAESEGEQTPSARVVGESLRIVKELISKHGAPVDLYVDGDGGVCIAATDRKTSRILVVVEPDLSASWYVARSGDSPNHRHWCDASTAYPDLAMHLAFTDMFG